MILYFSLGGFVGGVNNRSRADFPLIVKHRKEAKMAKYNIHVTPRSTKGWQGKVEGARRASCTAPTKKQAVALARELSKAHGGELIIHKLDGTIQARDSHGNDPYPPKG